MTNTAQKLREQGEADYKAGKPIGSFFDLPLKRHTEDARGSYEIGWAGAKRECAKQAKAVQP